MLASYDPIFLATNDSATVFRACEENASDLPVMIFVTRSFKKLVESMTSEIINFTCYDSSPPP